MSAASALESKLEAEVRQLQKLQNGAHWGAVLVVVSLVGALADG